jgi:hypothetical protein
VRSEFIYAARARWRADNLDIGTASAELHRAHADLLDALGKAKDNLFAVTHAAAGKASKDDLLLIVLGIKALGDLPGVREATDALHAARDELRATEKRWREIDQFTGNRARRGIMNNFTEPTDAELEGSLK